MRCRIHRGASEIGGSCIEAAASGGRLVLDLGLPLAAGDDAAPALPSVERLGPVDTGADSTDPLLAVLVTHAHPDHYGLLDQLPPEVAVYMGAASEAILREAAFFGAASEIPPLAGHLEDGRVIELGPFRVTPLLVDHSAFDAYALVIEADDRRLLYSGDLRAHGRKPRTFQRLLKNPPSDVDVLLLEGTRLSRFADGNEPASEAQVEQRLIETMRATEGLVLALYSPQNIDRLVSVYRATLQADRDLVIDLYTAAVAAATSRPQTIPQASWDRVRVYVPQAQRIRVKRTQAFERVNAVAGERIYSEELAADPARFVLTFRASMRADAETMELASAAAIWSMWPGYLRDGRSAELEQFLATHQIPLSVIHASGHATVDDLRQLAHAVAPRRVVPIHTEAPARYLELYDKIEPHANGEWWEV